MLRQRISSRYDQSRSERPLAERGRVRERDRRDTGNLLHRVAGSIEVVVSRRAIDADGPQVDRRND